MKPSFLTPKKGDVFNTPPTKKRGGIHRKGCSLKSNPSNHEKYLWPAIGTCAMLHPRHRCLQGITDNRESIPKSWVPISHISYKTISPVDVATGRRRLVNQIMYIIYVYGMYILYYMYKDNMTKSNHQFLGSRILSPQIFQHKK